jgi:hypothetical protein
MSVKKKSYVGKKSIKQKTYPHFKQKIFYEWGVSIAFASKSSFIVFSNLIYFKGGRFIKLSSTSTPTARERPQ